MRAILAISLAGWASLGIASAQPTNASAASNVDPTSTPVVPIGHGVNLGDFLEAPSEGAWSEGRHLQEADFLTIKQAGFSVIRVPICWAAHVSPAPDYTIDPVFLNRVDWVATQAKKKNL